MGPTATPAFAGAAGAGDPGAFDRALARVTAIIDLSYERLLPHVQTLMFYVSVIEIAFLFLLYAFGRQETIADLIRKAATIAVFVWIIRDFDALVGAIHASAAALGVIAGSGDPARVQAYLSPSVLIGHGFSVFGDILMSVTNAGSPWPWELGERAKALAIGVMLAFTGLAIVVGFVIGGIRVFMTTVEFHLLTSLVLVLLPFAVLRPTAFIAERALAIVVSLSVKMMTTLFVLTLVEAFLRDMGDGLQGQLEWPELLSHLVVALLVPILLWVTPNLAAGLMSGQPSLNPGQVVVSGVTMAAGVAAVAAAPIAAGSLAGRAGAAPAVGRLAGRGSGPGGPAGGRPPVSPPPGSPPPGSPRPGSSPPGPPPSSSPPSSSAPVSVGGRSSTAPASTASGDRLEIPANQRPTSGADTAAGSGRADEAPSSAEAPEPPSRSADSERPTPGARRRRSAKASPRSTTARGGSRQSSIGPETGDGSPDAPQGTSPARPATPPEPGGSRPTSPYSHAQSPGSTSPGSTSPGSVSAGPSPGIAAGSASPAAAGSASATRAATLTTTQATAGAATGAADQTPATQQGAVRPGLIRQMARRGYQAKAAARTAGSVTREPPHDTPTPKLHDGHG